MSAEHSAHVVAWLRWQMTRVPYGMRWEGLFSHMRREIAACRERAR